MAHASADDMFPKNEHPIIAAIAVVSIIAAILLIAWARVEVHGTGDIEAALVEEPAPGDMPVAPPPDPKTPEEREVDAAVTAGRFATGFSP